MPFVLVNEGQCVPLVNDVVHRFAEGLQRQVVAVGPAIRALDVRGDDVWIGWPDEPKLFERA